MNWLVNNMQYTFYSPEEEQWLRDNYPLYSKKELTEQFNKYFNKSNSYSSITQKTRKLGLIRHAVNKYSSEEDQWLKNHFGLYSKKELAENFNEEFNYNLSYNAIVHRTVRLGLISHPREHIYSDEENEWLKSHCEEYCYEELTELFNERFNRNIRPCTLANYCFSKLGISKPNKGCNMYKDTNILQIGDISYQYGKKKIKIASQTYKPYGRYIMEQHIDRELLPNEKVIFLDGNNNNFDLSNLRIITRGESAILAHNKWSGKGEITEAGINYAKLKIALKERSR